MKQIYDDILNTISVVQLLESSEIVTDDLQNDRTNDNPDLQGGRDQKEATPGF